MTDSVPSAKQLENAAFLCTVVLVACLAGAILDGFDGVTSSRSRTYRLDEDPAGFRRALVMKWGFPAICLAVGAIALGAGALAARGAGKASTDQ